MSDENGVRRARVRVRYADTDQMGVTYHANYLVWFEVGRTDWLRESGWTYRDMEDAGVSLPVIEVFCQYHQPARYDDEIEIRTRATALPSDRLVTSPTVPVTTISASSTALSASEKRTS